MGVITADHPYHALVWKYPPRNIDVPVWSWMSTTEGFTLFIVPTHEALPTMLGFNPVQTIIMQSKTKMYMITIFLCMWNYNIKMFIKPFPAAKCKAVWPSLLITDTRGDPNILTSQFTMCACPSMAARCSAVIPQWSLFLANNKAVGRFLVLFLFGITLLPEMEEENFMFPVWFPSLCTWVLLWEPTRWLSVSCHAVE